MIWFDIEQGVVKGRIHDSLEEPLVQINRQIIVDASINHEISWVSPLY